MKVSARFDHAIIEAGKPVNLMVTIKAPEQPAETTRKPIRLVTTLDRSGSMSGEKLELVKQTMYKLLDNLTKDDELAVVWFDGDIRIAGDQPQFIRMTEANKKKLRTDIKSTPSGGSTNIGKALQASAQLIKDNKGGNTRVLLLTDGDACSGECRAEGLCQILLQCFPNGSSLSCFGYGSDWNEAVVSGLAKTGGGGYYFVENIAMVGRAFATEIGGLLANYADDVVANIEFPDDLHNEVLLNDLPMTVSKKDGKKKISIELGSLYFDEERKIVLQLETAAKGRGECQANVVVSFENLGTDAEDSVETCATVSLTESATDATDKEVEAEVAILKAARTQEEARKLANAGDVDGARSIMMCSLSDLKSVDGDMAVACVGMVSENIEHLDDWNANASKAYGSASDYLLRSRRGAAGDSKGFDNVAKLSHGKAFKKSVDDYESKGQMSAVKFEWNPAHPIGTCCTCGEEMAYNVPRLGKNGGFVHKATGKFSCSDKDTAKFDDYLETE